MLALAAGLVTCAAQIVAAQRAGGDQLIAQGALNYTFYCSSCHGGNAGGNPATRAPPLAGQPSASLVREIAALRQRAHTSRTPAAAQHASVLAQLQGEQIEGIAEYLASLAPPPSAAH